LLALFGGLFVYGLAAELQTSGFLAVYLTGLVVGNRVSRGLYNIQRFHDGIAWLAQISLFLMLGLLVTPSELLPYAPGALLVGLVLMFVARPLAVGLCLLPFRFGWREQTFIGWVGLRGAVPIVLAMFPWMAGLEQWHSFFNIAFFIVLISLLVQGWTVAPLARLLKLNVPSGSSRVQRTELGIPGQAEYEIVGYELAADSPMLARSPRDSDLPGGVRYVCVLRGGRLHKPAGRLRLRAGDQVYVLARPADLPALDTLWVGTGIERADERAFFGEFVLNPRARLADLGRLYGFEVPVRHRDWSILRYIHSRHPRPVVGDAVHLGGVTFVVREMKGARVTAVGLKLPKF
jgi:cell volume regulation protein A